MKRIIVGEGSCGLAAGAGKVYEALQTKLEGIESASLLRKIDRQDAREVPIVALTANAFQEDIQKCLDAGMNTHLSKPINPTLLIQTISDLINARQEQMA